jgi:DNA (cytosine-5)-methyltransferase 1
MIANTKIPIIDLFAGAGGFAIAGRMAGGDIRLSVEIDNIACQTLQANDHGKTHIVEQCDVYDLVGEDLRVLAKVGKSDPIVIVGGPPCQPFSKASYWVDPGHDSKYRRARARGEEAERPDPVLEAKDDDRRNLLKEFWRLVVESRADAFVMENVRSLIHPRNLNTFQDLLAAFRYAGYKCTVVDADAACYGVPQKRQRIFVLGSRRALPVAPPPTHSADETAGLPALVGVGDVLAPFAGDEFFEKGEVVEGRWADQLREIPPGHNYKYLTAWANHPHPIFEAETRFWNFLLKLAPGVPSWTINANPGPWVGPFHWSSRRLRIPELASIQTFPKGYEFAGTRRERVRQVGNAVPPLLASQMVSATISSLFETT